MSTNTEYPGQLDSINGRRRFVTGVSALGGAQLLGMLLLAAAEPPPEPTRISLFEGSPTCAREPERVARVAKAIQDKGLASYENTMALLREKGVRGLLCASYL